MMIGFSMGVSSFYFLLYGKNKLHILIWACALLFAMVTFYSALYPPFLIPLTHLAVLLLLGLAWQNYSNGENISARALRFSVMGVALAIGLAVLYSWFKEAGDTIQLMQNTVYPGHRVSIGGDMPWGWTFSGYLGMFLGEDRYPAALSNPCVAGNFILLFPLALIGLPAMRKNGTFVLAGLLGAYIVLLLVWGGFGLSPGLAAITRLDMSPPTRTLLGLGVASILMVIIAGAAIASNARVIAEKKITRLFIPALIFFCFAIVYGCACILLRQSFPDFYTWKRICLASVILSAASYFYITGARRAFCLAVFLLVNSGVSVNPIMRGIEPLQSNELQAVIQKEQERRPGAWIVSPNFVLPQFMKANGAQVWNGARFLTTPDEMSLLDPGGKQRNIWYRYAHFAVEPASAGTPPKFILAQTDVVVLQVDPCSIELEKMGINHIAFAAPADLTSHPCLKSLLDHPVSSMWLYSIAARN